MRRETDTNGAAETACAVHGAYPARAREWKRRPRGIRHRTEKGRVEWPAIGWAVGSIVVVRQMATRWADSKPGGLAGGSTPTFYCVTCRSAAPHLDSSVD